MKWTALFAIGLLFIASPAIAADEYRLEKLAEPAPSESLSPSIAEAIETSGLRVLKGKSRTVVDLWPAKQWPAKAGFEPSSTVLYPFEVGTFVGVVRFKNRGSDFRGFEIPAGVYTVRYAQQPVDGNHVGTSDTQDFLLLLPAKEDKNAEPMSAESMNQVSPQVTGATHPAMFSLLRSDKESSKPAMHHDEDRELWSVQIIGNAKTNGKSQKLPVRIVVVGQAEG